jgi:hypothetical protein
MAEQAFSTPEDAAQALAADAGLQAAATASAKVCFGPSDKGWFQLSWSAPAVGKYDWIGLYSSPSASDGDYIGGSNWQWATNGPSYVTNTACQPGYEARYLSWDAGSSTYKSVARTGAFPATQCSS